MIIPAIITVGILGALALTRETQPSPSELDAQMAMYGRMIAEGRAREIDPGQLQALATHLRNAGRTNEAALVETWLSAVRFAKQGRGNGDPPIATPMTPDRAAAPLPSALQARVTQLTQQGEAASPFALEQLAGEIERVSPGNYAVEALRSLARANRALMEALRPDVRIPAPIQGAPPAFAFAPLSGPSFAPRAAPVMTPRFSPFGQPFFNAAAPMTAQAPLHVEPSVASRPLRCTDRSGCALFASPSRLYPTGAVIPFMNAVAVLGEEGEWLRVLHGTTRGWVPKDQFSSDLVPGAPPTVSFGVPVAG